MTTTATAVTMMTEIAATKAPVSAWKLDFQTSQALIRMAPMPASVPLMKLPSPTSEMVQQRHLAYPSSSTPVATVYAPPATVFSQLPPPIAVYALSTAPLSPSACATIAIKEDLAADTLAIVMICSLLAHQFELAVGHGTFHNSKRSRGQ